MRVADRYNEIADFEVANLRHHVREERVGCYIERQAEEHVGTSLVELQRETAFRYVELKKKVARRKRHFVQRFDVPRAHYESAAVGVRLDFAHNAVELVNMPTV